MIKRITTEREIYICLQIENLFINSIILKHVTGVYGTNTENSWKRNKNFLNIKIITCVQSFKQKALLYYIIKYIL